MSRKANSPHVEHPEDTAGSTPLWSIAYRHKWLVLLGLAVGLILAALYASQLSPVYQSTMKVLVVKKRPDALPLPGADPHFSFVEDYLATHQVLIRSPLIVGEAVREANLQKLESFASAPNPTSDIIRSLTVTREATESGSTNILNLSFRSSIADDCPVVLNAVVDRYKNELGRTYDSVNKQTLKLISEAKDKIGEHLTKKDREWRKFREKSPELLKGKDGLNVRQTRLFDIEAKRSVLLFRQAEIQEQLQAFQEAMKTGQSSGPNRRKLLAMVSESVLRQMREGKVKGDDTLPSLLAQQQTLLEDYGPDHPHVRALRRKIEQLRAPGDDVDADNRAQDPVEAPLLSLTRELESIKTSEKALDNLLVTEKEEAKNLLTYELKEEGFRKEITRNEQLFENIVKRLAEMSLLKDFGGDEARTLAPAVPGYRVGPKTLPIFGLAALLGLLAGLGLAYLAESSDHSFRSADEVRRSLGMPVMGQIPYLGTQVVAVAKAGNPAGPAIAPILCAYHQPKSRESEAYRGVRTGLFFSIQGRGHKVIQVTSPNMGDGKSTLAANLAISLAQAEKKVILIDADFRRPVVHKLFGLSPRRGLGSVLTGDTELSEVIFPSGVDGLSILPCGPIPANPAELLSFPRFAELLAYIREQFDFVIVDTPPLLAVTDPCMVVSHVDGVLLTVRLSKQARPAARRAKEILNTLDAKVVGVVVNALQQRSSGYAYQAGYEYGYGAGEAYFHPDTESEAVEAVAAKS